MADFDLGQIQTVGSSGIDALFEREKALVTPQKTASGRRMVASLRDLTGFVRTSGETLVNKSNRDLWTIKKEGEQFYIERLFDDTGSPLKG